MRSYFIIVATLIGLAFICAGCTSGGDASYPIPLALVSGIYQAANPDVVAIVGDPLDKLDSNRGGTNQSGEDCQVSESFGTNELHQLFECVNSAAFQAPLTNFNCGDPVPLFHFQLTLHKSSKAHAGARRVAVVFSPALSPSNGHVRCLMFGMAYSLNKAFVSIDPIPDPWYFHASAPHGDCSKRDSGGEWVSWPGPDEYFDIKTRQWK